MGQHVCLVEDVKEVFLFPPNPFDIPVLIGVLCLRDQDRIHVLSKENADIDVLREAGKMIDRRQKTKKEVVRHLGVVPTEIEIVDQNYKLRTAFGYVS